MYRDSSVPFLFHLIALFHHQYLHPLMHVLTSSKIYRHPVLVFCPHWSGVTGGPTTYTQLYHHSRQIYHHWQREIVEVCTIWYFAGQLSRRDRQQTAGDVTV